MSDSNNFDISIKSCYTFVYKNILKWGVNMNYIILGIEEDKLIRNMIVRVLCANRAAYKVGILIAVHVLEEAEKIDVKPYYVERVEKAIVHASMPYAISFSVLYKDKEAREKFIDIVKKQGSYF